MPLFNLPVPNNKLVDPPEEDFTWKSWLNQLTTEVNKCKVVCSFDASTGSIVYAKNSPQGCAVTRSAAGLYVVQFKFQAKDGYIVLPSSDKFVWVTNKTASGFILNTSTTVGGAGVDASLVDFMVWEVF